MEEKDLIPGQYHIRYTSGGTVFCEQETAKEEIPVELAIDEKIVLTAPSGRLS